MRASLRRAAGKLHGHLCTLRLPARTERRRWRDAAVLARLLAQGATPAMLAQFGALRSGDRDLTVRLTDTMARIFTGAGPAQTLLGASLGLLDAVAPARRVLAELMMYGRR